MSNLLLKGYKARRLGLANQRAIIGIRRNLVYARLKRMEGNVDAANEIEDAIQNDLEFVETVLSELATGNDQEAVRLSDEWMDEHVYSEAAKSGRKQLGNG